MPDEQQPPPSSGWQPPAGPPPEPSYLGSGYSAPAPPWTPSLAPGRAPWALAVATITLSIVLAVVQVASWATSWSASDTLVRLAGSGTDVLDAPLFTYDLVNFGFLPTGITAYVVGCLWLQRARSNVGLATPDWPHARGRVWVWLGWWVPVVSLWFPYQVVRDVRGGSLRETSTGPLGLWWTGWLVFLVGSRVASRLAPTSGVPDADAAAALPWIETVVTLGMLVALVLWIRIIREVTAAQRRWEQPD